jgi:hypothetical protein
MKMATLLVTDAWRAAQQPEAIAEAITLGEQIASLLTGAGMLIDFACQDVTPIVPSAVLRSQVIVGRIIREMHRLTPVVSRLRAAGGVMD